MRSTLDIFNTLRVFTKKPIREQEIKLECMTKYQCTGDFEVQKLTRWIGTVRDNHHTLAKLTVIYMYKYESPVHGTDSFTSPTKEIQLPNFQFLMGGMEVRNLTYRSYQSNSDTARITQQCWHHWELIPVLLCDRQEYKSLHHKLFSFSLIHTSMALNVMEWKFTGV